MTVARLKPATAARWAFRSRSKRGSTFDAFSSAKAKERLGYEPLYTLHEALHFLVKLRGRPSFGGLRRCVAVAFLEQHV